MNAKLQTRVMIGVAVIVVGIIIMYVSLSSPKVYETTTTTSAQTASVTSSTTEKETEVGVVNLNTATVEELTSIDGIGEKRAKLIVAYREEIGEYTSVSQIKNIEGIGDKVYAQISPYLTV